MIRKMGGKLGGWSFPMVLIIIYLSIDVLSTWGMRLDPSSVAKSACSAFPYLTLAKPVVSNGFLDFVRAQCLDGADFRAVSIIAFMAKFSITLLAIPICWLSTFAKKFKKDLERYGNGSALKTYVGVLKGVPLSLIPLGYVIYKNTFAIEPRLYATSIIHKSIVENAIVFFFFLCGCGIFYWAIMFVALTLRKLRPIN